ncbi:hypothetical protein P175DRAFT_0124299 [Aspergillus ochraceoroseus IBT 24754]|uniref:Uncharacterized protein n=1 Tax=Aspergillus ochraceoroseus IBT 24754 TaxID=1392256 RepID=A0A2T5LKR7_9EURO|nr:uncharacterized protein P175DRAFT_0124299 [Aspergillus ochraceoroseus IBT 24754]PTU16869.1 hypothetical protein P175DRAFT_0124299 [Aspergillus ochraceoroseus IBT 24754]
MFYGKMMIPCNNSHGMGSWTIMHYHCQKELETFGSLTCVAFTSLLLFIYFFFHSFWNAQLMSG